MPPVSSAVDFDWRAQAKQRRFRLKFAAVDVVLGGGSAGGGKSDALLAFNLLRRERWPGSNGLYLRRHFTELFLQGGAIPRSHQLFTGKAAWNGQEKKWTWPNGSVLQFGHLNTEEAKYTYHSGAFEDICFDEVTSFTETQYLYLGSRARTPIPGCRAKIRGGTNPGNIGHGWVKARFIDSQPPLTVGWFIRRNDQDQKVDDPESYVDARSRAFVPFRLEDNEYLYQGGAGQYEATLAAMPESDYRALRWGDWAAWQGMVFKSFQRHTHVVDPCAIPDVTKRWAGLDWGVARPFVCLWLAAGLRLPTDPTPLGACTGPHVYVYREVARTGLSDEEMAQAVKAVLAPDERIDAWGADPNSFFADRFRSGQIPRDVFARQGILLHPSNNNRLMGKRAVDSWLRDCACGVPRLRVFSTCVGLIKTLPDLPYDPIHVEDVDTDAADDYYDALRYGLMLVMPKPAKPRTELVAYA